MNKLRYFVTILSNVAPPVDHAWRLQIGTAKGTVVVPFAFTTNYTEIGSL
jgi:hypothetical protein